MHASKYFKHGLQFAQKYYAMLTIITNMDYSLIQLSCIANNYYKHGLQFAQNIMHYLHLLQTWVTD